MDIGIAAILGTVWRWVFNAIKNALGLQDTSAEWVMLILSLVLAVAYNLVAGGFAGIAFDLSDPVAMLEGITAAWAVIVATSKSWYSLTKNR
jgi:hypothetical protein